MARVPYRILVSFLALLLGSLTLGCERELPPQLISVLEIAPREAEVGDHFAIGGAGFPEGKSARVTFRGQLRRPGTAPLEGAVVEARGTASSRDGIDVLYTAALQAEFCGQSERAAHTTFFGDVEVAFAAVAAGAPPVTAVLRNVTLDLRPPSAPPSVVRERMEEGGRVLAALGIHPKEPGSTTQRGIAVETVDARSSAEEAGILPDDLLTAFDGVRIVTQADAIPQRGASTVELTLRRGANAKEETRILRAENFARAVPTEVFGAALLIVVLAAGILLFVAPPPRFLLFFERLLSRTPEADGGSRRRPRNTPMAVVGLLVLAIVPMTPYATASDLDIPVAFLLMLTLLVLLALLSRGTAGQRLGGALRVLGFELPVGLALAAAIGDTGSLRVRDVVAMQGGWPWDFVAFRSPAQVLLFALFLLAAAAPRFEARQAPEGLMQRVLGSAEHLHLVALAGIAAAVFLGGWTLPLLSPGVQRDSLFYGVLGSALFLAKVVLLIVVLSSLRRVIARVSTPELTRFTVRWMIPLGAVALGASLAWAHLRPHPEWQRFVGLADAAIFALAMVRLLYRTRLRLPGVGQEAHLNPFL